MNVLEASHCAIGIEEIAVALPTVAVDNRAIVEKHGFDAKFIEKKLGIGSRWRLSEDDSVSAMAGRAVDALFDSSETSRDAVELIVVVTQTPDYCMPGVATLIQHASGLPRTAAAFDVGLGCSGYVYGLAIARGMMMAEGFSTGVLVTADAYSRIMTDDDRATSPLFGDAASATLLSRSPRYHLSRGVFGSDGAGATSLIARGTGSKVEAREPLFMNGRAIYEFMMTEAPASVMALLEQEEMTLDDVDAFVFHQASRFMLESLAKSLKIQPERLVVEMSDVGNTTSSSIPIALKRRIIDAAPTPPRVLLSGFGVGLSWASVLLSAQSHGVEVTNV